MDTVKSHICLNCKAPLADDNKFCTQCGQGTQEHLLNFKELVIHLWNSFTNLDNTAFNTIKYIWAPWKLTEFYIEGRKKSFLNPIRVFLVTMLFHLGMLVSSFDFSSIAFKNELYEKSMQKKMFETYKKAQMENTESCQSFKIQLDTTLFSDYDTIQKDTVNNFSFNDKSYTMSATDIIELKQDSINIKYNYNTFIEKLLAKQFIRALKEPDNTFQHIFGNLIWAILLTVLSMAFFFKLLYYRKHKLFLEHLVFLLNVHSLAFIVNSIWMSLGKHFLGVDSDDTTLDIDLNIGYILLPSIIFTVSLYKYYQQSFIKTGIKAAICSMVYLIINVFFISLTAVVSFFIF